MQIETTAQRLETLGNTTRLEIFRALVRAGPDGLPVGALQDLLQVPASTLSHHISKLVWAGLVDQERKGRSLICRAEYAAINEVVDFLTSECCRGFADNETQKQAN